MREIGKKIRQYKFRLLLIIILAVAAGLGIKYYNSSKALVAVPNTISVGQGDIKAVVSATGTIKSISSVDVSSRVTGLIIEVKVRENDIVSKGQVLVVLDDTVAREQLAQYEAQVVNYEATYERTKKLVAVGGLSLQQLDTDRMNYLVAKANRDNYAAQLDYYIITAPADGMVIGTPSPVGTTIVQGISAAQTILSIADMNQLQIKVLVDETDIGKIKQDQAVSFTVDAYSDKIFTGKVVRISREATTSSNVVYYPVYVAIDSRENLLFPTMTARATISVGERNNVLTIPLGALKEEKGQKYVEKLENGIVKNTIVVTGLRDDENVEIMTGLADGDLVVVPKTKNTSATSAAKQNQQGPQPQM